jgi:hypothetical protein
VNRLRHWWRRFRLMFWATSPAGLSSQRALDDVWDQALENYNPCHDRVREWIVERRRQLDPLAGPSSSKGPTC